MNRLRWTGKLIAEQPPRQDYGRRKLMPNTEQGHANDRDARKAAFLAAMRECVDRYQPQMERSFGVKLGAVEVKELTAWNWMRDLLEAGKREWLAKREQEKERPPTRWEKLYMIVSAAIVPVILFVPVWVRFWIPELLMKWDRRKGCIYIPFNGWNETYFKENAAKIDQWVVHEMAHGVWEKLVSNEGDDEGPEWRMWNEGFAHYVADEFFRQFYPPGTALTDDWSDFRKEGKRKVAELVEKNGTDILQEIPARWREFSAESVS